MAKGLVFGVTNGIITMLALITGMYASKVDKVGVIAAILAILIADPLSDAYSMYVSEKNNNSIKKAFSVGKEAFLSQFVLQLIFLLLIIFTPTVFYGLMLCYIFGLVSILGYAYVQKSSSKEILMNLSWITLIISVTYFSDVLVHKYYKGD